MVAVRPERRGRERLLVAGGGMAGLKLVEELTELCPRRYEIVMVGKEPRPPYNRVLLSSLLAGEAQEADVELRSRSWFADKGIALLAGVETSRLCPARREVVLSSGTHLTYDRLVLATGSKAIRLPIPGHALPGVLTFRDFDDVEVLRRALPGSRAVVVGGGLLGVEAACGLAKRGLAVTLIHIMPRLMERQLDARAADLLKAAVERKGVEVVLDAQTAAIEGNAEAERLVLRDGRAFPTDLVVVAAGIRPETTLAKSGAIGVGRGIVVDDKLETSQPGIYAIGECAEHRGQCYGMVEPVHEQARVLARHLAGDRARYEGSLAAASLKVSGVAVFSMSDFEGEGAETIVLEDEGAGSYRKLVIREGRLAGAVLFGDTGDALWYRDLVRQASSIAPVRAALAFGKAFAEAA
jgi:nitrite reductase (NADH) large subunit